jgi:hypothetical protein
MLITPEEERRVKSIAAAAVDDGKKDVVWLCALVQRLLKLKPTEEDFPAYAAVIDRNMCAAFAVKFLNTIHVEQSSYLQGNLDAQTTVTLLDYTTQAAVCDAILCVRPYVRLVKPRVEEALEQLSRQVRIWVEIDGELVLNGGPLEEHLVGPDGYGKRRKPFHFRVPTKHQNFYLGVGELQGESRREAVPTERGVFLPNSSKVRIWMSGIKLARGEVMDLSTGLVLGLYSTKGLDAQHTVEFKPRKEWQ